MQPTKPPAIDNKVRKPGIASFLVVLIVGILAQFGIDVRPEVAAGATGVLAFIVGYLVDRNK